MENPTGGKVWKQGGVCHDILTTQVNIRQLQGTLGYILFPLVVHSMQLLDRAHYSYISTGLVENNFTHLVLLYGV